MPDRFGIDDTFLKSMYVLYVEDDPEVLEIITRRFGDKFALFTAVSTGEEALEMFSKHSYDLVMTDYFLPGINGMELTQKILAIKKNMPIIMITGHVDMHFLVAAINMGVTQFVAKPIQFRILKNAIFNAVERVVLDNLRRKTEEQELEILKYRESYHSMQQELTLRKEMNLIHNDLYMRYFSPDQENFDPRGWNLDIFYEAHDIVCGDIYSLRKLDNRNAVALIIDAMGKGISASLTSVLSVSVINHLINKYSSTKPFDLHTVLTEYLEFIKNNLMDEEILCLSVVHFDFGSDKMRYAAFSMPRMCVEFFDGTVKTLPSNNLPVMKYLSSVRVSEENIEGVTKILIHSDGLIESAAEDGGIYSDYLEKDFSESFFIKGFESKIRKRIPRLEDDASVFFITRPFAGMDYTASVSVPTRYASLEKLEDFFAENMNRYGLNMPVYECFCAAFSEIILNAYEHGNLAVGSVKKEELIANNGYEEFISEQEKTCDKLITVRFSHCGGETGDRIIVSVRDEGEGYPEDVFKNNINATTKFSGRGLRIIGYYSDDFFFSEDRREIFIAKAFGRLTASDAVQR